MVSEKIAAGAAIALAVALALQSWRLNTEQTDHVQTQLAWSKEREGHAAAALQAQTDYNAKAAAERERAQQANTDAKTKLETLAVDLGVARTERERLRRAYETAIARSCSAAGTPAVAGASQATSAPAHLLADVPARIDEAADRIAKFAELAMSAAETCASAW